MSVPGLQTIRNGHIITFVFKLLISKEDKKDSLYSSKSINVNVLQEEPEFQEPRLQKMVNTKVTAKSQEKHQNQVREI